MSIIPLYHPERTAIPTVTGMDRLNPTRVPLEHWSGYPNKRNRRPWYPPLSGKNEQRRRAMQDTRGNSNASPFSDSHKRDPALL